MTDLTGALQAAVLARLTAALSCSVYDVVPPEAAMPYAQLGRDLVADAGSKDARLERHEIEIVTYGGTAADGSAVRGRAQVRALQEDIRAAMTAAPLRADGCAPVTPVLLSAEVYDVGDGRTFEGVQRFLVFLAPR